MPLWKSVRGIDKLLLLTSIVIKYNIRRIPTLPEHPVPMSRKLPWTDAQDSQIRRRRAEGASWDAIANDLSLTLFAVTERGHRIGADHTASEFVAAPEDPLREPLPPGHKLSWDAITASTVLEGVPYPLPVFRH
jgi:hypothetical protein